MHTRIHKTERQADRGEIQTPPARWGTRMCARTFDSSSAANANVMLPRLFRVSSPVYAHVYVNTCARERIRHGEVCQEKQFVKMTEGTCPGARMLAFAGIVCCANRPMSRGREGGKEKEKDEGERESVRAMAKWREQTTRANCRSRARAPARELAGTFSRIYLRAVPRRNGYQD